MKIEKMKVRVFDRTVGVQGAVVSVSRPPWVKVQDDDA